MSKLSIDFINLVHLKCFNVFFYQFDGFADVIIYGHKRRKMLCLEVKATSMNSVKGKIITKYVILMSMTYLQCSIVI